MTDNESDKHKQDPHYLKAKKEGYRARSAYKLLDIQKKYNIFKRAFYILDIGSAPGSWLQVAKEFAEENLHKYNDRYYYREEYKIMGIDVNHVTPIENVKILRRDATEEEFIDEINSFFHEKVDLILSDASINKSGNKFSDHIRQIRLCYSILDIASQALKQKGNLLIKTFQGSDFKKLYNEIRIRFKFAKAYKPRASKKKSNEIYLIGLGKK